MGSPNPREAAKVLIEALAAANDPPLADFAEHMKSNDAEHLAQFLVAPCHFDLEELLVSR